jgi:CRISPR/Cas system-associated exonuclease Cas4 (RecB family)
MRELKFGVRSPQAQSIMVEALVALAIAGREYVDSFEWCGEAAGTATVNEVIAQYMWEELDKYCDAIVAAMKADVAARVSDDA